MLNFIILILLFLTPQAFSQPSPLSWFECKTKSDCVLTPGDECHDSLAINKAFEENYIKVHQNAHADEFCVSNIEEKLKNAKKEISCLEGRCVLKN